MKSVVLFLLSLALFSFPLLFCALSTNIQESLMGEFDFDVSKKRKSGGSEFADLEPDKKRRGPRRNALWTPEDDEMFQKVYNVYGKSWKTIHNYMPGKTREQVQSHGQYLIRIGKLEDVKSGPRRGRKGKKEKETPSPTLSHSSHHSSHSHHPHHPHTHSSHHHVSSPIHRQSPPSLSSPQPSPSQPPLLAPSSIFPSSGLSFSPSPSLSHLPYDEQGSIIM
eukprot:Phypoly_transcript_11450.p1 GENE.Phypoly_transcript_11450~~Phypoly_transcript_11450.p1  ORF type:complete len:222 (+),score=69.85 Phypoly_transcript_11450:484-1149(+)